MSEAGELYDRQTYSLSGLLLYFLKLGAVGFGGPIALVGYMERDLLDGRGWLTREEFVRGLALSQLAPGPLAAQLAMYIGYIRGGFLGATAVGIVFVLPSFLIVVLLGILYVAYGGLEWMQALFYGIGAAVVGIIVKSAYRLARVTLKESKLLWAIFAVMGLVTAYTAQENLWLFLLGGIVALLVLSPPRIRQGKALVVISPALALVLPLLALVPAPALINLFLDFAKAGSFVFGSGLAIVPFLHGSVVQQYHWLTERQFLDAVAVAMITPGPVVITVGFIGYLVDGIGGAVASGMGVFLPVFLVVVIVTPLYERVTRSPQVKSFVHGVTAAATGAIAGAVFVLGRSAITDVTTGLIALGTLAALVKFKLPEPVLVACAGILGLLFYHIH